MAVACKECTFSNIEKVHSLHVPAMKFTEEVVGLKNSNYTLKITVSMNMWNLGQFN